MSTNHTPNYALSLWEASDQVLRTEFNENHAKIDAALAGMLGRMETIFELAASGGTASDIGMGVSYASDYEFVIAFANFPDNPNIQMKHTLSGYAGVMDEHILAITPCCPTVILFWTHRDNSHPVQGILFCKEVFPFKLDVTYDKLKYYGLAPAAGSSLPSPARAVLGFK